MSGFEPLPGLLDDPQFQITDLPHLSDYHIAPLRNPAPSRSSNAPLPLEPIADNTLSARTRTTTTKHNEPRKSKTTPKITPEEVILARDTKKPNLAISELVEASTERDTHPTQLPSFISLAIVEKSPVQRTHTIDTERARKRLRLELELESTTNEDYRHLPFPSNKDGNKAGRAAPLLPAMVTGLHEPPPTAALLPSMETQGYGATASITHSKVDLDGMAREPEKKTQGRPPEQMLNSPELGSLPLAEKIRLSDPMPSPHTPEVSTPGDLMSSAEFSKKTRRVPRKWTEQETEQLMVGVRKYGIGKWKQVLADPEFKFEGRSAVDLKDRFRVREPKAYRDRKDSQLSLGGTDTSQNTDNKGPTLAPISSSRQSKESQASDHRGFALQDALLATPSDHHRLLDGSSSRGRSLKDGEMDATWSDSRSRRRKRRPWTSTEDENLVKGVAKHGFQWTLIHDDAELDLCHRKATDLRDRIRNIYPDGYKNADTAPLRSERSRPEQVISQSNIKPEKPAQRDVIVKRSKRTKHSHAADSDSPSRQEQVGDTSQEQQGLTLPPLILDDDDWDWSNNTLPPLLDWEEMDI